jgi:hypothetical protein
MLSPALSVPGLTRKHARVLRMFPSSVSERLRLVSTGLQSGAIEAFSVQFTFLACSEVKCLAHRDDRFEGAFKQAHAGIDGGDIGFVEVREHQ